MKSMINCGAEPVEPEPQLKFPFLWRGEYSVVYLRTGPSILSRTRDIIVYGGVIGDLTHTSTVDDVAWRRRLRPGTRLIMENDE